MHSGFSSCHYCGAPQIHSSEKEARELRKFTDQVVSNNFLQKSSSLHLTGRYCEVLYKSMCFCLSWPGQVAHGAYQAREFIIGKLDSIYLLIQ